MACTEPPPTIALQRAMLGVVVAADDNASTLPPSIAHPSPPLASLPSPTSPF